MLVVDLFFFFHEFDAFVDFFQQIRDGPLDNGRFLAFLVLLLDIVNDELQLFTS